MFNSGDVVIAEVQFTDTFEIKKRPALVLFEEFDNVVKHGKAGFIFDPYHKLIRSLLFPAPSPGSAKHAGRNLSAFPTKPFPL